MKHLFILLITIAVLVGCEKKDDNADTQQRTVSYYVKTDSDSLRITYSTSSSNATTFFLTSGEWSQNVTANVGDSLGISVFTMESCNFQAEIKQDTLIRKSGWKNYDQFRGVVLHLKVY